MSKNSLLTPDEAIELSCDDLDKVTGAGFGVPNIDFNNIGFGSPFGSFLFSDFNIQNENQRQNENQNQNHNHNHHHRF